MMGFDQKPHLNNVSQLRKKCTKNYFCGLLHHIKISIFKIPLNSSYKDTRRPFSPNFCSKFVCLGEMGSKKPLITHCEKLSGLFKNSKLYLKNVQKSGKIYNSYQ